MGLFSKKLGDVPVPGDATLTLPADKVKVDYDERREGREADDWPGSPDGLVVTITPAAGGAPLEITPPRTHHDYTTMRRIGSRVGSVEIPAAGDYTVSVASVPPSDRELYEPTIKLKT